MEDRTVFQVIRDDENTRVVADVRCAHDLGAICISVLGLCQQDPMFFDMMTTMLDRLIDEDPALLDVLGASCVEMPDFNELLRKIGKDKDDETKSN